MEFQLYMLHSNRKTWWSIKYIHMCYPDTPVLLYSVAQGHYVGFPGSTEVKNAGDTRDSGLISGSRRSSREGNDNPLQYFCLENSMDRGAWQATTHRVRYDSESDMTQPMCVCVHGHTHTHACLQLIQMAFKFGWNSFQAFFPMLLTLHSWKT